METTKTRKKPFTFALMAVWLVNCLLGMIIAINEIWIPNMRAQDKAYQHIKADPFDGTSLPITHIPDWTKSANQNKALHFHQIPVSDIIPIPHYDINALQDTKNTLMRFTYTVPYMGSYTLNYKENDGSHLGIDIRAPIGTPVLSIANGVVVRAVEADNTGNKFVVIRHENVPVNGKTTDLYSGYLHLSEITVTEGSKIRKGEMLGRVGTTGITTTPHLHFQIDTADAPFHPYWPFSMSEARKNGMSIFQAVTAGLGRDNASRYTINPLAFVQHGISGNTSHFIHEIPKNTLTRSLEEVVQFHAAHSVPDTASEPAQRGLEEIVQFRQEEKSPVYVASHIVHNSACKNLLGLDVNTAFGMIAATLHDESCLFDHISTIGEHEKVTRGQALIALMKFYRETPLSGTSRFLDIPLSDTTLQGYAVRAYQKGIFRGQTISPDRVISKGEFIEVLSRFGKLQSAPAGHTAITDVDEGSTLARALQDYGYTIGAKDMKLAPNAPLTQGEMVMLLKKLQK